MADEIAAHRAVTPAWRLEASASPYLRQHSDNPIEWFE
jgi:uncharacterized protein YyaL (SSP411 family)